MRRTKKAFTLVEILIVVVILGVLASIAIPRFATASDDARTAAVQSTVAGVRASIATFRTSAVIHGESPYPSITAITDGTVLKMAIPVNAFTNMSSVQAVSEAQANTRTTFNEGSVGWNYFVDNNATPPLAIFYANTTTPTTAPDGSGGTMTANEL